MMILLTSSPSHRSVASLDMHGAYSTKEEAKLCETKPGHHFEKDDLENPLGLPSGAFAITARPYWKERGGNM